MMMIDSSHERYAEQFSTSGCYGPRSAEEFVVVGAIRLGLGKGVEERVLRDGEEGVDGESCIGRVTKFELNRF